MLTYFYTLGKFAMALFLITVKQRYNNGSFNLEKRMSVDVGLINP